MKAHGTVLGPVLLVLGNPLAQARGGTSMMLAILLAVTCGTERWNVKTAKDAAATQIDATAQTATIEDLRNRTAPAWSLAMPRQSEEKQTLTIVAYLDGFKTEGDSDYHVGIRNDQIILPVVYRMAQ